MSRTPNRGGSASIRPTRVERYKNGAKPKKGVAYMARAAPAAGRWTVTIVPPAVGHAMVMFPRWASMRRFAVGKPSPEPRAGQFFRSLPFPKAVDATRAKADYKNGMLNITVPVAPEPRATRVDIKAA